MCKMDVPRLISLVKERRAIWDQKDYNYKNRDVVKLLWEEVAAELDRPLEKARKRWKNLRDMFRNEIKKILLEAGDSLPEEYVSSWTHFEDMIFLKDQIVTKKTLRNLNIEVDLEDSDDNEEHVEISVSPVGLHFEEDEDESVENTVNEGTPEPLLSSSQANQTDQPPTNISEIIPTEYQNLDHFLKPSSNSSTSSRKRKRDVEYINVGNGFYQPTLQIDDDYHFLISFLPSLKNMNFQTKMWFRLKMQELLYTCVLNETNANSQSTPVLSQGTSTVSTNTGTNTIKIENQINTT